MVRAAPLYCLVLAPLLGLLGGCADEEDSGRPPDPPNQLIFTPSDLTSQLSSIPEIRVQAHYHTTDRPLTPGFLTGWEIRSAIAGTPPVPISVEEIILDDGVPPYRQFDRYFDMRPVTPLADGWYVLSGSYPDPDSVWVLAEGWAMETMGPPTARYRIGSGAAVSAITICAPLPGRTSAHSVRVRFSEPVAASGVGDALSIRDAAGTSCSTTWTLPTTEIQFECAALIVSGMLTLRIDDSIDLEAPPNHTGAVHVIEFDAAELAPRPSGTSWQCGDAPL